MKMDDAIDAMLSLVATKHAAGADVVVLAIDGRSGVGKSILAARFCERAPAALIDGDAFFAGGVAVRNECAAVLATLCIDWRKQRQTLQRLRAGLPVELFPFDWEAFDESLATVPVLILPYKTIVLEGVYSGRSELGDVVDIRVLLTLPDELRLKRLVRRDGPVGPWQHQWHRAEDHYFRLRQRQSFFDLVVSAEWTDCQ